MSFGARREYLKAIRERYQKSSKVQKVKILDEFCWVCGYSRKYATRILNQSPGSRGSKPGPRPVYDAEFGEALLKLWHLMRRICSKKMVEALPEWLPDCREPLGISAEMEEKLLEISAATIDRVLKPHRRKRRKGFSSTRPGRFMRSHIPLQIYTERIDQPGFVQADTVAHCGGTLKGAFGNTLTITDVHSTWTENRATWTKTARNVFGQIQDIEKHLPFQLLGYSVDNGGEVLNEQLYHYFCEGRKQRAIITRSRPYKKNDNAHVEQKNNSHVRQLFGYQRVSHPEVVALMNEIYREYSNPLQNFFIPSMKMKTKLRDGSRIQKWYDQPKTPYQRLLESEHISDEAKQRLKLRRQSLNPQQLSEKLDQKLKLFFKWVKMKKLYP